jgi:superfamily II DNA helicase RecQ
MAASVPSFEQIRSDTERIFGIRPCVGQVNAAIAQLHNKTDIVFISGTGSGKTLTFWIPMIYEHQSITILVTALNILGQQTTDTLQQAGIPAINVTH